MTQTEQIQAVEERLRQAMLTSDVEALDALLADDLIAAGPDGRLVNKAEDLAAHRAGEVQIKSLNPQETTLKLLPDVAIAFVLMDMQVTFRGQEFAGLCRYTRVWNLRDGQWQVVAAHISPLP